MSSLHSTRSGGQTARSLAVAALLLIALMVTPSALLAHAHLEKSEPSSGARITSTLTAVRLWFSEAPELAFTTITLLGPDSGHVSIGEVQHIPGEPLAVTVAIRSALAAGEYTVAWQTAAADGHPSRGRFSFEVQPSPTAQGQMSERRAEGTPHSMSGPASEALDTESPAYVAVRWLSFAALLTLIGVVAFRVLVVPGAGRLADTHARQATSGPITEQMSSRAAVVGVGAAAALLVAHTLRLYAQLVAMQGRGSVDVAMMRQMVAQTHWGMAWLLEAVGSIVALLVFVLAVRTSSRGTRAARVAWAVATAAVLLLAFTPALGGHAAAVPRLTTLAIAADGLHILGAGGWLGALLIVLTLGVPVALAAAPPDRGALVADLVNAFSPTALVFASVVVLTGVFTAWLHLGSLAAFWGSGYGRTLLLKLGILIPVLGTGAYNWRRVRPALGDVAAANRLRRSAFAELAIGGLVILVTAILVGMQTPK